MSISLKKSVTNQNQNQAILSCIWKIGNITCTRIMKLGFTGRYRHREIKKKNHLYCRNCFSKAKCIKKKENIGLFTCISPYYVFNTTSGIFFPPCSKLLLRKQRIIEKWFRFHPSKLPVRISTKMWKVTTTAHILGACIPFKKGQAASVLQKLIQKIPAEGMKPQVIPNSDTHSCKDVDWFAEINRKEYSQN